MPWKEVSKMSEKEYFVLEASKPGANRSQLCKQFGITRKTGYKFLKRFKDEGAAGLEERSRAPKSSPNKTPSMIEEYIVCIRDLNPYWGGDKIAAYLEQKGHLNMPCAKTIARILKRYGRITPDAKESTQKTWKRFEHENPNDLWQMDFKGHFKIDNGRCHPLTVLDDNSRYSLLIKSCGNERGSTVKTALIETFRKFGLPKRMTMDNGSPWGCGGAQDYTQLSAWLMRLGIHVTHSRPGHPQTQGKLERFHRTLKLELLSQYYFSTLELAQEGFDWWQRIYNEVRPHAAIGNQVPAHRYRMSNRPFPERLPTIEYDSCYEVRKVQGKGEIFYRGKIYLIGKAFRGNPVALQEKEKAGLANVYFCNQKILELDLERAAK